MANLSHLEGKQFYIVTGINFSSVSIEFFTDPLAYGRALAQTQKDHARGDVEAWTCGTNTVDFNKGNQVFGHLYIALLSDDGATAEFFADEEEYLKRLLELKKDYHYQEVDALEFNGPDIDFDPEAEDDDFVIGQPYTVRAPA